jgi:hypothetical protein
MSAADIIKELPKLTEAELRSIRQRLLELAAQNEDIALCVRRPWKARYCSTAWRKTTSDTFVLTLPSPPGEGEIIRRFLGNGCNWLGRSSIRKIKNLR